MSSRGGGALLQNPTKKCTGGGGPFTTGVPCNPETGVGLQAALVDPASAHLRVAEKPVRRSARSITLAVKITSSPFSINKYTLLCKLCYHRLDDHVIYMCMSKGFCTEECRDEYFLEYKYKLAMAMMEAEGRRTRSEAAGKAPVEEEEEEATGCRCIFFISAEIESVPLGLP